MKKYRATNSNLPVLGKPLVDDFRFTCDTRQTVFQSTMAMREALVIEAKPTFKVLAHNKLSKDETEFNITPAISGNGLSLRSDSVVYRIEKQ